MGCIVVTRTRLGAAHRGYLDGVPRGLAAPPAPCRRCPRRLDDDELSRVRGLSELAPRAELRRSPSRRCGGCLRDPRVSAAVVDASVGAEHRRQPAHAWRHRPRRCRAGTGSTARRRAGTAVVPAVRVSPALGARTSSSAQVTAPRPARRRACGSRPAPSGRSVKYWTNPIAPCASSTASSTATARRASGVAPTARSGEQQADGQPDEQEHQVGVQLADLQRVQAVARRVRVAGVRAGAGDHGADVQHQPSRRRR